MGEYRLIRNLTIACGMEWYISIHHIITKKINIARGDTSRFLLKIYSYVYVRHVLLLVAYCAAAAVLISSAHSCLIIQAYIHTYAHSHVCIIANQLCIWFSQKVSSTDCDNQPMHHLKHHVTARASWLFSINHASGQANILNVRTYSVHINPRVCVCL